VPNAPTWPGELTGLPSRQRLRPSVPCSPFSFQSRVPTAPNDTGTRPEKSSCRAAACKRSITRFATKGLRSLMRTMIFRPLAKLVTRTNVPIRRATFDEQPSTCQESKLRHWLPDRRLPGISMLYYFYYFLLPAIAALPATRNRAMVNIHLIICRVPDHDPRRQHFNLVYWFRGRTQRGSERVWLLLPKALAICPQVKINALLCGCRFRNVAS
jgi:hypothetical protein